MCLTIMDTSSTIKTQLNLQMNPRSTNIKLEISLWNGKFYYKKPNNHNQNSALCQVLGKIRLFAQI
jgi:hypothetical protein